MLPLQLNHPTTSHPEKNTKEIGVVLKRFLIALSVGAVALLGFAPAAHATPQDKVTICHRTNSETNPYVLITVNANAVDGEGQNDHTHHVVDEQHSRADIIPAPSVVVGEQTIYFCPGAPGDPGPEGPQGPPGEDGEDGHSPELTILCFPGNGLGVLVDYDGESQLPDGSHILGRGAICPLVGAAGPRGADGNGLVGPAGKDGTNGQDSTVAGPQGVPGPAGPAGVASAPAAPTQPEPASTPGELPRTGAGGVLMLIGLLALITGLAAWGIGKLMGSSNEVEGVTND